MIISGIEATIPAKIIIETPFPYPLSVICSPNQVTIILPAVRIAPITRKTCGVRGTVKSLAPDKALKPAVIPIDCTNARTRAM